MGFLVLCGTVLAHILSLMEAHLLGQLTDAVEDTGKNVVMDQIPPNERLWVVSDRPRK